MSLILKVKKAISEKRLTKTIKKKLYLYIKGFLKIFSLNRTGIKIFVTKNKEIDKRDLPLSKRIFESYKLMKSEQIDKSDLYKPSSLWQSHIDKDFDFLIDSYKSNDEEKFLYFLQNFGNWNKYLGVETQDIIKKYNSNILLKNYLSEEIFGGYLELWKYFNKDVDLRELDMPRFGNQIGGLIENNFVVMGSFFNQIYATNLLNYLDNEKNKFFELGAGYGKLAYYILKKAKNCTYIDFDIPESLVLAAYYLSKCFPDKKNFFYGENKFDKKIENEYNLIFLPPWEIENLETNSFNLAINKNSLGEMNPETAKNFLSHIHRVSKYFFSMNHEYFRNNFSDGKKSLVNKEYNLDKKFKELIRHPDLSHLVYSKNKLDFDNNIFFYIYEKK